MKDCRASSFQKISSDVAHPALNRQGSHTVIKKIVSVKDFYILAKSFRPFKS